MSEQGGGASFTTEPAAGTSQATDVSLREHLTMLIADSRRESREAVANLERQMHLIEQANKEAIDKALTSIDKRFDNVNEFRGALNDLSRTMATQVDVSNLSDKLERSVTASEQRFEGFYQRNRGDIDLINKRLDLREGQSAGSRLTTGILVTVITVAVGVIGLVVVLANYVSSH